MTDRLVRVLENGRLITRGLNDMGSHVRLTLDEDETLTLTINWTGWLGTEDISSTENEVDGPTAGSITTASGVNTFTVSGNPGWIQHRITTDGGQTKELRIRVQSSEPLYRDDYGMVRF